MAMNRWEFGSGPFSKISHISFTELPYFTLDQTPVHRSSPMSTGIKSAKSQCF